MQQMTNDESQLDRELAKATQRVREKRSKASAAPDVAPADEAPARQRRLSKEQREERDRLAVERRAKAKQERESRREQRLLERAAQRKVPHLSKVQKAAAQLPELSDPAAQAYERLVAELSPVDLNSLGLHLQHLYRHHATEAAAARTLREGQLVRLLGGPAKTRGRVGTVESLNRIRCYVRLEGVTHPVYVFTSETEDVDDAVAAGFKVVEGLDAAADEESIDVDALAADAEDGTDGCTADELGPTATDDPTE